MNNQLIQNIITSNNQLCPEFVYLNPLLDKNVADALAKSYVKILNLSEQSSNVSNNLRISILENIRKMCCLEPSNHAKVDENFTKILIELYEENTLAVHINKTDSVDKCLDAFLMRKMKEMDLNSSYKSSMNPEVIQALLNFKQTGAYLDNLTKDIINWDCNNPRYTKLLKDLWTNDTLIDSNKVFCDDISIKLKAEIECLVLSTINHILSNKDANILDIITSNTSLSNLVKKSSNSAECFQICCSILNYLFIMTNFVTKVQEFIELFIKSVKDGCSHVTFSVLYPVNISHIVVLLDFNIDTMPSGLRRDYIKSVIKYLSNLHLSSENDLIMLLSHFPQWFDVYYNLKNISMEC